jgi:hypothetical protein
LLALTGGCGQCVACQDGRAGSIDDGTGFPLTEAGMNGLPESRTAAEFADVRLTIGRRRAGLGRCPASTIDDHCRSVFSRQSALASPLERTRHQRRRYILPSLIRPGRMCAASWPSAERERDAVEAGEVSDG